MSDMILTEDEQMLQNLVRDFAERELMPRAKEIDEKEEFSWENWKGMADLGLTGISIDPKYGGGGGGSCNAVSVRKRSSRLAVFQPTIRRE